MDSGNVKKKIQKNTEKKTIQKSKNWKPKKVWTILWIEKVIILQWQKMVTPCMYFKLMVFDQISNVSHLECREIVEKAIENWELECTDCTENRFLKDFDLLKEKTEEPGRKLGKENREKQKENT